MAGPSWCSHRRTEAGQACRPSCARITRASFLGGVPNPTSKLPSISPGTMHRRSRVASGIANRTVSRRDTVWLCPAGWREGSVDRAGDQPEIVHIYLPPSAFSPDKLGVDVDGLPSGALRFESAVEDPLLGERWRGQSHRSCGRKAVPAGCWWRRLPAARRRDWCKDTSAYPPRNRVLFLLEQGSIGAGFSA